MKPLMRSAGIAAAALLALVTCAGTTQATTTKCARGIAKESAKFLQAKTKAMQKCLDAVVKNGGTFASCPDSKATTSITKAGDKLAAGIGKVCGGDDKACGGDLTNEDTAASVGFPPECHDFERSNCTNAITGCGDVATCLECANEAVVDQAMSLYYANLNLPTPALTKCQQSIGKASAAFLSSKSKALQKCWDKRLNDKHSNACTPPAVGDGKYLAALQKAETKKINTICKACGGADKKCDADINGGLIVSGGTTVVGSAGSDDATPAAIGFGATCPDVTLPYAPNTSCGSLDDIDGALNTIDSLRELILCVDCLTEFKTDCADAIQVPSLTPYPDQCNACTSGPPTGPCPTGLQTTAFGDDTDLDSGWTGVAHDQIVPSNGRLTLAISGCAGTNFPTCGQCNLTGPLPNAGGTTFANQRCTNGTWIQCTDDTPCLGTCSGGTNAGEPCNELADCPDSGFGTACSGGTCAFFFGAPLPLAAGNVPVCVTNQVVGTVSGTINLDTGESASDVRLLSRVHVIGTVDNPCPVCGDFCAVSHKNCKADADCAADGPCITALVCSEGSRAGQACTVNGEDVFGRVSFDCPPVPGSNSGNLDVRLTNDTGTESRTLTAANPNCRASGFTTLQCLGGTNPGAPCTVASQCPGGTCQVPKCLCDTCNTINAEPCSSNADCPISGGNPGICGGKRCLGGTNSGNPCNAASECPGTLACGFPGGTNTAPNQCNPADGPPDGCQPTANNEGQCVDGPIDQNCAPPEAHRGCTIPTQDTDCPVTHTCAPHLRECYTDNGVIGGQVTVTGIADPPCAGTYSLPTLGSIFCLSPTGSSAVNSSGGLPGPGRLKLPVKAILLP